MTSVDEIGLLTNLVLYLIQKQGGEITVPVGEIDHWMHSEPKYEFWRSDGEDGSVTFKVRELPQGLMEERVGEAVGLLDNILFGGEGENEVAAHHERALWLLSNGRKGDPRHDVFDLPEIDL